MNTFARLVFSDALPAASLDHTRPDGNVAGFIN